MFHMEELSLTIEKPKTIYVTPEETLVGREGMQTLWSGCLEMTGSRAGPLHDSQVPCIYCLGMKVHFF